MPQTWVFTAIATVLIGLLSWLFQRTVAAFDKKVDENCVQMTKVVTAVQEMRVEMSGYSQLVEYLSADVKELKTENKVLREAGHVFDKYIAVQQALQKIPTLSH